MTTDRARGESDPLVVSAFGAHVEIELRGVTDDESRTLRKQWARCQPDEPRQTHRSVVLEARIHTDTEQYPPARTPAVAATDAPVLQHRLASAVTLALIELVRDRYLLLHACAVADPHTGATVALIGPSGSGKTTAATVLGKSLGYVTDETVAIGTDLTVHPYPKPLSVVQPGSHLKIQTSPDELQLLDLNGAPTLRLAAIVLLDRRDDAPTTPRLEHVELSDIIAELVPQISYLSERERSLSHLAETLAAVGGIRRLSYRNATDLPSTITQLLHEPPLPTPNTWTHATIDSTASEGIRRAPVHDAISDGRRTIVHHNSIVRVLDGIAPTIWNAADGASLEQLTDAVIAEHNHPPTGGALHLVSLAVQELSDAGLLYGTDHAT